MEVNANQILSAIEAELAVTSRVCRFSCRSARQEGTVWKVELSLDATKSALKESLEGATATWGDDERAYADVLAVLPETKTVLLRYATAEPPVGGDLWIYPIRFLDALRDIWSGFGQGEHAAAWLHKAEGQGTTRQPMRALDPQTWVGLRSGQVEAFSLPAWRRSFLWGPPGTGKTFTLGRIAAQYLLQFPYDRVLLLSTTNSAIDEALCSVDNALQSHPEGSDNLGDINTWCLRVGNHFIAGLATAWSTTHCATERTEPAERAESTQLAEATDVTEDTEATKDTEAISAHWSAETLGLVEAAIARTIPINYGLRNNSIFRFVRALKAIPELTTIPPANVVILRPILRHWYERASITMQTKDFGTTWGDFVKAWANVRYAEGADPFGTALEAAKTSAPPEWSADYEPRQRLLASLCRELQLIYGDAPFFLACTKAGVSVGVDRVTAHRWFAAFEADQKLVCVERGSPKTGKATRWRYVANDLHNPKEYGTL